MRDYSRQEAFVPRTIEYYHCAVVGCGAIGRQVAKMLAAIGQQRITLVDFDRVEEANVTTQMFLSKQCGMYKVDATGSDLLDIDPTTQVKTYKERWHYPRTMHCDVVFACVDDIVVRGDIWSAHVEDCDLFVDGRMFGETMRVLTAAPRSGVGVDEYPKTLFPPEEAFSTDSCTTPATAYTANIAAGLMVHQYARFLRGFPIEIDQSFQLLTSDIYTSV